MLPEYIKGVIQVGANTGDEIGAFLTKTNKILCFEPVESALDILNSRITQNNLQDKVIVSDYIVSDTTGEVEFYVGQQSGNSSMFDLNPDRPIFHHGNIHDKKVMKKSITLDDFFSQSELNAEDYNFIFMDVQGAEHLVLLGAKDTLKYIDHIYMEVSYFPVYLNTLLYDDMVKLCDELGYEVVYHEASPYNQNQGDALFRKKGFLQWI